MRVGRVIYVCHCAFSLVEAFNPTQGLSHTRSSSRHSLVTQVQSQSVEHNHSGNTASCSIVLWAQLRVVQSDLQDTIRMMFISKIISKLCSAKNNTCQSEEASELGHIGLLYCLSSPTNTLVWLTWVWLSMWLIIFIGK